MSSFFLRPRGPLFLLAVLLAAPALAQATVKDPAEAVFEARLAHLAKVWGAVRYLHPYLAYKDIDWDEALVRTIPALRAAETREQYSAAVTSMLAVLGDPATRVETKPEETAPPAAQPSSGEAPPPPVFRWLMDGEVLLIDLRRFEGFNGSRELRKEYAALLPELRKAPAVILDLRSQPGETQPRTDFTYTLTDLTSLLVRRTVQAPTQRYVMHSGYRPQTGSSSGGYYSGFVTLFAETFSSVEPETAPSRVAFLVDSRTTLPDVALALQAAGDGILVSEGRLEEQAAVLRRTLDLGEGLVAHVRTSEVVPMPGWSGIHADVEVAPGAGDVALDAALAAVNGQKPATRRDEARFEPLPGAVWRPDNPYKKMSEPSLEYRLLAAFRMWNIIHFFYPYKHLIDDWDAVLPELIVRMKEARTGRDYAVTVAEMMTRVADSHTSVWGHPELSSLFGSANLPIALRWIEGRFVVTALGEGLADKSTGIEVGDILLSVDGEPVEDRAARLRRLVAASNEAALRNRLASLLTAGSAGSAAVLSLSGRDGRTKEVTLQRDQPSRFTPPPKGETVRRLSDHLGYVDLTRLTAAEVDGMFETLKDTRGIIFDMRGYPRGVFWLLGPRLNTRGARYAATFRRAQVAAISEEEGESGFFFSQPIAETSQWKYTGKTVMLIDERAISQSEHTGLFLEAANGTRFIGTPSAGANGDVTNFVLPGNLMVGFTGHDVRHADGRQLQRTGLVPDVEVAPTIQSVREGKDVVLDRAVEYLNQELGDSP